MATYLAIDAGTDRLAAGLVDDLGEVLVRDRVATPPRDVWPALHRLVRRVVAARPADAAPIVACGVTTEAPLDVDTGTVSPLHMSAWSSFPLRERMGELTGLPVVVDTAAHGRVVAERWVGAAAHLDDVMVVLLSTAVEAGIITGGRLARGRLGNAGALGHVLVEPDGLACPCGASGCLTPYVSAAALEEETNRPLRRAPASIVERAGVMLGRAVSSAAAVFDLRAVILTGFVPSVFGAALLDATRREIDQRSRLGFLRSDEDPAASAITVDFTVLGSEAPLVGAAGVVRMALADAVGPSIDGR
ncbi:MAG: ROK family protein [Desertimonas sp.]